MIYDKLHDKEGNVLALAFQKRPWRDIGVLTHIDNRCIQGWDDISIEWSKTWGFYYPQGHEESRIKQARRFLGKIEFSIESVSGEIVFIRPIYRVGRYVFTDQDMICILKEMFLFGRPEIAKYLNKSVVQLSRDIKKYPGLQKILRKVGRAFVYVNKIELNDWKYKNEYYRHRNFMLKRKPRKAGENRMVFFREKSRKDYEEFVFKQKQLEKEDFICPICEGKLQPRTAVGFF